ncbi:MAG: FtsL-like putative cell division protein, partial [Bacteroidota bacterium]
LILLVAKGYYDKQLTKEVDSTQKELDELMGDYVAKKAELEENTKRITLVNQLSPIGLKETVNPTKVIRIKK